VIYTSFILAGKKQSRYRHGVAQRVPAS